MADPDIDVTDDQEVPVPHMDPQVLLESHIDNMTAKEKEDIFKPNKHQYMLITFNYKRIVVPYAKGLLIVDALKDAEEMDNYSDHFRDKNTIVPLKHNDIHHCTISQEDYLVWKTRALLFGNTND